MSGLTAAPTCASAHRLPIPEISSTSRSPADPFPSTLAELELVQLHVLHSRVTRQLDRAYRTDPAGKRGDGPSRPRWKALSDQTLREAETPIQGLDRLRPGYQIEIWYRGEIQYVGTVEETAASLCVMWGREALDGYRRMVHTQDTELRHHLPSAPQ